MTSDLEMTLSNFKIVFLSNFWSQILNSQIFVKNPVKVAYFPKSDHIGLNN